MGEIVGSAVGAVIGAVVDGAKEAQNPNKSTPASKDETKSAESDIRKCIEELLTANSGFGTIAHKLPATEKTKLLLQMAGDDALPHGDIVGIYDATFSNSFSGNQMFYCKYCEAKTVRPIGSGKPFPSQCTIESQRRKVPTPHMWLYKLNLNTMFSNKKLAISR